ncbi:hypothetical protein BFJ63_vAg11571 [Fusarium oxysporum f. sp. narcissi]|uniref:Protein kinase domain-containing protein n=1 Tax=Fusarium oxysporum f. sp. narcissi TaxID=451672 RepID=A0A4Q2VDE2_FUSOX|nr:hypothetical protein BFJ63_vAg11571 [Fusarium oxysporum f. sp. narcissi]
MLPLGMSLRSLQELQQGNVFQETLVTSALDQTLLGFNYLHDADVIHTARKFIDETVIHVSQYMLGGAGSLTICDPGQARIGKVHGGIAMPPPYRAPEVILGMTWGNSLDVSRVGLLGRRRMFFSGFDKTRKYWDAEGRWYGLVPLPSEGELKSLDTNLSGEDRDNFLDLLACVLTWLPEDWLNSPEAYFHPWLRGEGGVER